MSYFSTQSMHSMVVVCLLTLATACAPLQPIPEPPVYYESLRETVDWQPLPLHEQPAELTLRWNEEVVEGRLTEPPMCRGIAAERRFGTQTTRHQLSREDDIIMRSAYIGAGVTAGLVAIGMARGRGFGRGVAILGLYAIPLGAVGAAQTWRAWPVTEAVEAVYDDIDLGADSCPSDTRLMVMLYPAHATHAAEDSLQGPDGFEPDAAEEDTLPEWLNNLLAYPGGATLSVGGEWTAVGIDVPYPDVVTGRITLPLTAVESHWVAVIPATMPPILAWADEPPSELSPEVVETESDAETSETSDVRRHEETAAGEAKAAEVESMEESGQDVAAAADEAAAEPAEEELDVSSADEESASVAAEAGTDLNEDAAMAAEEQ